MGDRAGSSLTCLFCRFEGVAGAEISGIEALFEPVRSLGGGAVGERFRADMTGGHSLQTIVSDGGRCAQR